MKERKRKGGLAQAALALLILYCAVLALPAAVYGAAKLTGKDTGAQSAARGKVSPTGEPAPESRTLPEASPESAAPGFLEGQPLPEENGMSDPFTLKDQSTGETFVVSAQDLIPAAVACEMDLASPTEALKAQAVACYTLFSRKRAAGEIISCETEAWQTWTTEEQMKKRWGEDFEGNLAVLKQAAQAVSGELLTQDGEPILAAYFAISSGSTETAGNVWEGDLPYLQAVASPGDILSDGYLSTAIFTLPDFQEAAASYFGGNAPEFSDDPENWLTDLETTPSGYVKSGVLCGKKLSGTELRSVFSLRSACFQLSQGEDGFTFTVRGWGHGVGMSQAGAVFLAKRGENYRDILSYYYPGAAISD